jgi:cytochrome c oxidase subunit 1
VVSHLHYVLFGGSIFAIIGALYYWFPKMTGRLLDETLGKIHFWLMFVGMNLVFMPMHFLGLSGMPRRIYTYSADQGWSFWNMIETIGAFLIAVSFLVFIYNFIKKMREAPSHPADPWDAATLEWKTSSPPPVENFETIPVVHSRRPFWDEKYPDFPEEKLA